MRANGILRLIAITILPCIGAACGYDENPPIMVAVSDTVGISASGGASDQGAELAVGVKGRKLALVPVTLTNELGAQNIIGIPKGNGTYESHSVLATLAINGAAVSPTASIEQVVAIGGAADAWANGRAKQPPPWDRQGAN